MGAKGKLHGDFEIPKEHVGELIATSLRANSWQNLNYNDLTQEITGEQKKTDKRSGIPWAFDYRLSVSWEEKGDKWRITIDVHDREVHSMERDCKQLAFDILQGISDRAERVKATLQKTPPKTSYGTARWSNAEDIEAAGYAVDEIPGNGFLLGPLEGGKKLVVPESQAIRHTVICGPTGCGKSSSLFIPNLIERVGVSAIVTEATAGSEPPDLYTKTAGYRARAGHKIYYFNPDDPASVCINPLDQIDVSNPVKAVEKAIDVVDLIIRNTTQNKHSSADPFWENAERNVLTSLVLHVAAEHGDMAKVRSLLREGGDGLGAILAKSKVAEARDEYSAFSKLATETLRNNVLSGAMQRLSLWLNPKVVALTSKTNIDVKALPGELFTFYLAVPAQKEKLKPAASLVFNFLLDLLLETPEEEFKNKTALVLDEFTNFGLIPGIAKKMTIVRHRKMPVILGIQDYVQLKSVYGDDDATLLFTQPATRVIFRTPDLATAKKVSESLGQETIVERKLTTTCQVMEREFGRSLMTPAEVMALDPERSIVFTPSTDPLKISRYSWKDYLEQTNMAPPSKQEVKIDPDLVLFLEDQSKPPNWEAELDDKPPGAPKPSKPDANEPPQMDLKPGKGTPVEPENTTLEDEQNDLASDLANVPPPVENKEPVEEQKVSPKDDSKQVDDDEYLPI